MYRNFGGNSVWRNYGKFLIHQAGREPISVERGTQMKNQLLFKAIIPDNAARKEGRDPNHDGEYLILYWNGAKREYGRPQWILQHNAGVCATHHQDYEEVCSENNFGLMECTEEEMGAAIAEAKQIQYEIYELIRGIGEPFDPVKMGNEAQDLAIQWGWFPESDLS